MNKLLKNFAFINDYSSMDDGERELLINNLLKFEEFTTNGHYSDAIKRLRDSLEITVRDFMKRHNLSLKSEYGRENLAGKIKNIVDAYGPYISARTQTYLFMLKNMGNTAAHPGEPDDQVHDYHDAVSAGKWMFSFLREIVVNIDRLDIIVKKYSPNVYGSFREEKELVSRETQEKVQDEAIKVNSIIKINNIPIYKFILIKDRKFEIPIYQRSYTWGPRDIKLLLDDIYRKMNNDREHYLGVIAARIIKETKNSDRDQRISKLDRVKIIDGQQRLTTSLILMGIMIKFIKENYYDNNEEELRKDKLFQEYFDRFTSKTFSTYYDNPGGEESKTNTFFKIMQGERFDSYDDNFAKNAKYIEGYLSVNIKTLADAKAFFSTFTDRFVVGAIGLDITNKEEMEIFENINARGKALDSYDLIKNFIINLVSDEEIENNAQAVINIYGNAIESHFVGGDKDKELTSFIKTFVMYFTGKEISKEDFNKNLLSGFAGIINDEFEMSKTMTITEFEKVVNWIGGYANLFKLTKDKLTDARFSSVSRTWFKFLLTAKITTVYPMMFLLFEKLDLLDMNGHVKRTFTTSDNHDIDIYVEATIQLLAHKQMLGGQGDSQISRDFYSAAKIARDNSGEHEVDDVMALFFHSINEKPTVPQLKSFLVNMTDTTGRIWAIKTLLQGVEFNVTDQKDHGQFIKRKTTQLEHLMPKNNKNWKDDVLDWNNVDDENWDEQYVNHLNRIGNFTLLSQKLNLKNSNKKYIEKHNLITKSMSPLTTITGYEFGDGEEFSFNDIVSRTKTIVNEICSHIHYDFVNVIKVRNDENSEALRLMEDQELDDDSDGDTTDSIDKDIQLYNFLIPIVFEKEKVTSQEKRDLENQFSKSSGITFAPDFVRLTVDNILANFGRVTFSKGKKILQEMCQEYIDEN